MNSEKNNFIEDLLQEARELDEQSKIMRIMGHAVEFKIYRQMIYRLLDIILKNSNGEANDIVLHMNMAVLSFECESYKNVKLHIDAARKIEANSKYEPMFENLLRETSLKFEKSSII